MSRQILYLPENATDKSISQLKSGQYYTIKPNPRTTIFVSYKDINAFKDYARTKYGSYQTLNRNKDIPSELFSKIRYETVYTKSNRSNIPTLEQYISEKEAEAKMSFGNELRKKAEQEYYETYAMSREQPNMTYQTGLFVKKGVGFEQIGSSESRIEYYPNESKPNESKPNPVSNFIQDIKIKAEPILSKTGVIDIGQKVKGGLVNAYNTFDTVLTKVTQKIPNPESFANASIKKFENFQKNYPYQFYPEATFIVGAGTGFIKKVKNEPTSLAVTGATWYAGGIAFKTAETLWFGKLALKYPVITKYSTKILGYGLAGTYATQTGLEVSKASNSFEAGKILGKKGAEFGSASIGVYTAELTFPEIKNYTKYIVNSNKYSYYQPYKMISRENLIEQGYVKSPKSQHYSEFVKDTYKLPEYKGKPFGYHATETPQKKGEFIFGAGSSETPSGSVAPQVSMLFLRLNKSPRYSFNPEVQINLNKPTAYAIGLEGIEKIPKGYQPKLTRTEFFDILLKANVEKRQALRFSKSRFFRFGEFMTTEARSNIAYILMIKSETEGLISSTATKYPSYFEIKGQKYFSSIPEPEKIKNTEWIIRYGKPEAIRERIKKPEWTQVFTNPKNLMRIYLKGYKAGQIIKFGFKGEGKVFDILNLESINKNKVNLLVSSGKGSKVITLKDIEKRNESYYKSLNSKSGYPTGYNLSSIKGYTYPRSSNSYKTGKSYNNPYNYSKIYKSYTYPRSSNSYKTGKSYNNPYNYSKIYKSSNSYSVLRNNYYGSSVSRNNYYGSSTSRNNYYGSSIPRGTGGGGTFYPFKLYYPSILGFGRRYKKTPFKLAPQPQKYTPSFTANILNIKSSKIPKFSETGLVIRPLIIRR
jgi:hypothetical protein